MAKTLLDVADATFDQATPLEQALIGTFFFGMITAHGMANSLEPPEIHALALIAFRDSLHYSADAAARAIQDCIDAANPAHHPTMNTILHRGIDGHAQYTVRNLQGLGDNLNSILAHFRASQAH
ncbi:MAG: hypothetical protein IT318_26070 [Anaerolineales bacterium]|nr:hypothetical protein [Anaerolineales bacterium]